MLTFIEMISISRTAVKSEKRGFKLVSECADLESPFIVNAEDYKKYVSREMLTENGPTVLLTM